MDEPLDTFPYLEHLASPSEAHTIMKSLPLNLQFKGGRNYLHGSDVYNAVNSLAPVISGRAEAFLKCISFRAFSRNDADLYMEPPGNHMRVVATGEIFAGDNFSGSVWVVESDRRVTQRYPFDEGRIVKASSFASSGITLSGRTGYSPIEEVIAVTKALCYKSFPVSAGKWLFGQLDLKQPFLAEYRHIRVETKSSIGGRFTFNLIYQDDICVGSIRFIVGEP